MTGGLSGNGGRGADGGDIYIGSIDTDPDPTMSQYISVEGGNGGDNAGLKTPAAEGPLSPTADRCSFVPAVPGSANSSAARGVDGSVQIRRISSANAWNEFITLITAKDGRIDYDYRALLSIGHADTRIRSMDVSNVLSDFLVQELINAEVSFVDDVDRSFGLNQAPKGNYVRPLVASIINNGHDFLPEQQGSIIRELGALSTDSRPVLGYLKNTNGLFDVPSKEQTSARMAQGKLRIVLGDQNVNLTEIGTEMQEFNETFFESTASSQASALKDQIATVKSDLAKAIQQAQEREQQSQGSFVGLIKVLIRFGTSLGDVESGLETLFPTIVGSGQAVSSVNTNQAYNKFSSGLKGAGEALHDLNASVEDDTSNIASLQLTLSQLTTDYERLIVFIQTERTQLMNREYQGYQAVLNARSIVASQIVSEALLTPDIVKVALIGYLQETGPGKDRLRSNLSGIRAHIAGLPFVDGSVKLTPIDWGCGVLTNRCAAFPPSEQWREVQSDMQFGQGHEAVVLYVLKPSKARRRLPIFGVKAVDTSLSGPSAALGQSSTSSAVTIIVVFAVCLLGGLALIYSLWPNLFRKRIVAETEVPSRNTTT